MKITEVSSHLVQQDRRPYLVVTVGTDEGVTGIGEAGLSGREHAVAGALVHLAEAIRGENPMRTEWLWQRMWRSGFFPAQGAVAAAAAAVDIALWDIKGKALDQPVYALLGGAVRDAVPCYTHVGTGRGTDAVISRSRDLLAEGWRFLRYDVPDEHRVLEPGAAARTAAALLTAVRESLGGEPELIVDAHTRLDLPEAVWLARELEPVRPYFVEDPLRAELRRQYRQLRQHTRIPLAAGEQFASKWEFGELVDDGLIDYARVDPCVAGGLTEALKVAAVCEAHGVRVATHNALGPVSTAACLHLNMALTPFGVQEQPYIPGSADTALFPVQQGVFRDGALAVTSAAGLGVVFDPEAAAAFAVEPGPVPEFRRRDGGYANW